MPRPIWTGNVSFGLVNIPVRLVMAVRRTEIAFHQLHGKDNMRLRQRLVCPADGEEVSGDDIVKGYEIAPDQYVLVEPDELEALAPERSRNLDITDFVDQDGIDPLYYDRPYYLLPEEDAERPYSLLVQAMKQAHKVGIAKFVMRHKEYLAALRPVEGLIVLEVMRFASEVIPAAEVKPLPLQEKVDERQLKVADELIATLATNFNPAQYHDEYTEKVEQLLQHKAEGKQIVTPPVPEREPTEAVDLLAALEQSLAAARDRQAAPA